MTHVALLREEVALTNLKQQLGATDAAIGTVSNPSPDAIEGFLLRYLRQCSFNVGRTVFALQQRREYERNLTGVTVTPYVIMALKSGAFTILGEDVLHRPVLHIRMTHHRPPTGGGDAGLGAGVDGHGLDSSSVDSDRLFIVLLEYLHSLTMKHHSSLSMGARSSGGSSTLMGARQECTVLITGGDSGGVFSQRRAGVISKLTSLAVKYYPGLIGSVLVVDANWIARQGIKATAAVKGASERISTSNRHFEVDNNSRTLLRSSGGKGSSGVDGADVQSTGDIIKIVRTEQLPRHMDPGTVLPEDFGGRKHTRQPGGGLNNTRCCETTNPTDFSQIVLRHWFNVGALLAMEDNPSANSTRPLWQPLPVLLSGVVDMAQSDIAHSLYQGVRTGLPGPESIGSSRGRSASAMKSRNNNTTNNSVTNNEDDGVCSVMTDEPYSDDGGDISEEDDGGVKRANSAFDKEAPPSLPGNLSRELKEERSHRMALEHELANLTLGAALDDSTLTRLEGNLRVAHNEVNTLISEVIQRSKAQSTMLTAHVGGRPAVVGGRELEGTRAAAAGTSAPSLHQLLELTDKALLQALHGRQSVPAVDRFATPSGRRVQKSCTLM